MMFANKHIQTDSRKGQIIFALVAVLVLSLSLGCQNSGNVFDSGTQTSDEQLIQAIQDATNRQNINAEELPSAASTVLEQDYSESYVDDAIIAPELGYEVGMRRGMGSRIGERSQVYFNLNGRKLNGERDSNGNRHRGRNGRDREECFDFVYPITYIMPDGSTITGNDREEICLAVRSWYETNPDSRERPALQYPVDITFEDGTTVTINNDEEMRGAYERCE